MVNKDKHYTIEEYEELQNKEEYKNEILEYFNGTIVAHSKTSIRHNEIIMNIATKLKLYFKGTKCKPYTEQIELKFHNENDTINVFPDVFVACDNTSRDGESFTSAPLIIFEIVSENYRNNDYIRKLRLYQKYGVREYIIVEQNGEIIQYNLKDGVYEVSPNNYYKSYIFDDLSITNNEMFE